MSVLSKHRHMVGDGITPKKIEACQTSEEITDLAKQFGWHSGDLKQFAQAAGISWGQVKKD